MSENTQGNQREGETHAANTATRKEQLRAYRIQHTIAKYTSQGGKARKKNWRLQLRCERTSETVSLDFTSVNGSHSEKVPCPACGDPNMRIHFTDRFCWDERRLGFFGMGFLLLCLGLGAAFWIFAAHSRGENILAMHEGFLWVWAAVIAGLLCGVPSLFHAFFLRICWIQILADKHAQSVYKKAQRDGKSAVDAMSKELEGKKHTVVRIERVNDDTT